MHAKEVAVKDRREDDLVDYDFRSEGEDLRGVIEASAEIHKPECTTLA